MTRTRRAIWGVLSNYASAAVVAVAGFVLVPIVIHFLGREDYGLWATIGQVLGYLALLDLGVGSAVMRRAAQLREAHDIEATSRVVSTAVALYCVLGLVFLAAGLLIGMFLPYWSVIPRDRVHVVVVMFFIMVAYGAISFPLRVALSALIGYQQMALANAINFTANLLTPVIAVALLFSGTGLLALPLGSVCAGLMAGVASIIMLRRVVPGVRISFGNASRVEARELFGWSWLLFLNNIAVVIIYQTDNMVIAAGAGLTAVTVYTLTSRLPLYAMPLVFALGDSCLPAAVEMCAQGKTERLREVYMRVMRLTAGAALCVAVVAVAFNESFMRLWVGANNYGGATITLIFAFILVYRVMQQCASMIVIATGKLKGVVIASLIEAALNLILSLWWIRRYGIVGVAFGTAIAGILTSGWYVARVVSRELRLNVFEYLARGLAPPLVCVLPAAGAAFALTRFYTFANWPSLTLGTGTTGAVYALAYFFIGLSNMERGEVWTRAMKLVAFVGARRRIATP